MNYYKHNIKNFTKFNKIYLISSLDKNININWENLLVEKNDKIDFKFINKFSEYFTEECWKNLIKYQDLSNFLDEFFEICDISTIEYIFKYQKITAEFVKKNVEHSKNKKVWLKIIKNNVIESGELLKIIEQNENNLYNLWQLISIYAKLDEKIINKYHDRVYWIYICEHQKLSEKFIERWEKKVNWDLIMMYQKLSEEFIEKWNYKFDLNMILYQRNNISYKFIEECKINWSYVSRDNTSYFLRDYDFVDYFVNYIDWDNIIKYNILEDDFKQRYQKYIKVSSYFL